MKKLLYILIGAAAMLTSCSNVDENERLIEVVPVEAGRNVLIEDFTGQNCVNCPNATEEIEKIQHQYGADTVIAVGIHSGPLGFKGNSKYVGLVTPTGDEYYNYWGIEYQPQGLVNRRYGRLQYTDWAAKVNAELSGKAPVELEISNAYNEAEGTVNIDIKSTGVEGVADSKMQVWIIENGITAMQMMPDGKRKLDYVHNHVFRAAVNGIWGDDFSIQKGEIKTSSYSFKLDAAWVADNISVVAFVYDKDGIHQVKIKSIK